MTVRVITFAGTLELGRPAPGAPNCQAPGCDDTAHIELDVPNAVRGLGRLRLIDNSTRPVALCAHHLADAVARGMAA